MGSLSPVPELKCMDPENYGKYFQEICWNSSSTRKSEKKPPKKGGKKEKLRKNKSFSTHAACFAPTLLANPSQFAVYATVRQSILQRWRHLQEGVSEVSDDSDIEETTSVIPISKLPKITGIGLRTVFALISQARFTDSNFCEQSLSALLDVLQGHAPEELSQEPSEIIINLHSMLAEVASGVTEARPDQRGRPEIPTPLTALGSSCLISLSVARGEAELILSAVSTLIISAPSLSDQYIQVPSNLTTLQRSVQSVLLGNSSRNQWLNYGVPQQALFGTCPVEMPAQWTIGTGELVLRSLCSDGCYLYVFTSRGLIKIGSGYGSSIKQHTYLFKGDFFAIDRHGWLGYCKNKLYVRVGRKKTEVFEVDKDTLEIRNVLRLDPGTPAPVEHKSAVFTDGNQLGLMMLTNFDSLTIRMYSVDNIPPRTDGSGIVTLTSKKELNVHLLRRRTLALGRAPFDDNMSRRTLELDAPVAMQLDDNEEDPLMSICGGQDFGLLTTMSGKVYYTGKGASLGYKSASPSTGRWTLMKETLFTRNEAPNAKKAKVIQVAVGHEGAHAILVLDNGTALFTGIARRGEDGDGSKHRRTPKPTRPKKMFKVEGHHVVYAACNYGSTALVTRQGLLLMFGKDTQHCDSTGLVIGLKHERVIQVALGKAHAAALTNFGQVYTFGINNKGQCGREFGYTKEKSCSSSRKSNNKEDVRICQTNHTWKTDYCRVCVLCRECTGFSNACHCTHLPNRIPGEKCGCGEGDSGCSVCGACRRCADTFAAAAKPDCNAADDDDADGSTRSETRSDKETSKYMQYEEHTGPETERDASLKVSCLPPARVSIPGGHRVAGVACGLHHTVILTEHGEVLTFGSNQYGQLGAGDVLTHHRIVRVRVPRASFVAAGSNHTAILTREGELYTFGNYQNGCLGRPRIEDTGRSDRCPIWYATPHRVPRLGPRFSCKAVWVSASGDQTFVQVSQSLIKTETLFSCTITANSNCIVILPNRPEHSFKCITINKADGTCKAWTGPEQVDFVNTLACLDPLYDVFWCYQPQMRVMKCYNILAFDSKNILGCFNHEPDFANDNDLEYPNYGFFRRLEDFKNLHTFDFSCNKGDQNDNVALSNVSVLNQELAIPTTPGFLVTRMHAALYLLGCLDSLTYAHDTKLNNTESKRERTSSPVAPVKEDFLTVNRFESHGGGWGYSGHSVEAIRFMCDTDILLGGFGLFGGRGDYTAKIKLFDIGPEGGDQEGDGELIAESDEIVYECAPRDRFPVLFESPVQLVANRWYVAWACINGPSSDCGSSGQAMVINDDIAFQFKTSKKSNNGTDVNAGQIPSLLYNAVSPDHLLPTRKIDSGEPVIPLSKNISRKVTVPCFRSLISLLLWSWTTFQQIMLETNGLLPINFHKVMTMKHQKRLVYIIRASLRLVKSYILEIYPQHSRRRNSQEFMSFLDAIAEVRNVIQGIMADPIPTCSMLPKKPGKNKVHRVCYVQFALEMTNSILAEAHETFTACFYAFFPTPILKWSHLCSLLFNVRDGIVSPSQIRELTATSSAMCASRSLRDVLQYIVPVTQGSINLNENRRPDSKLIKDIPTKSATVPRSSHGQKPPPVPPRANSRDSKDPTVEKQDHTEWHLLDVVPRLLDIIMNPIKQQILIRQCGQPHDHGEIKQQARLSEFCCKLIARIIAEMTHSATNIKEELDTSAVKPLTTPSRFMRVNQSRAWNTGNGSPDAICFTVDRPGVVLVGICVYGGLGNYEYSLELLHDVRQLRSVADETVAAHCWVSVEVAHGAFCASDCQHDTVQLKFDKPIPLKEDLRYALRLCNHGGRTANGDCGLPSVKGPDGTTFRFSSCSLSFNGTTLARGQIPSLIYYGTSKSLHSNSESADALVSTLRAITLRVASIVIDSSANLFCSLRNELTPEDLRRNANALQQSHAINSLIPFTLANLSELDDSKSVIKLLDMIHKLLPHVAAMNLLIPVNEDVITTPSCFYTWVESDHPYKQATVTNMRVLFPASVSWIVLEMDPRSVTAQPEDTLTVYAYSESSGSNCHCNSEVRTAAPPFRKRLVQLTSDGEVEELDDEDVPCMHYNCRYYSVTPKLSNVAADWPQKALLIPGSEVIFSLETASDYLNEYNKSNNEENRFGFRCLCIGYEDTPMTSQRQGLPALEMELIYAGAACASRLLAPDLDIPSLSFSTIVDVQVQAMIGSSPTSNEGESSQDPIESLLMSRGLELSSPPTIHQVLDGQPLLRSVSTERQFLSDFVAGAESTAGGRLARWLAPTSRVEPSKCELKLPLTPVKPGTRVSLPVVVRDQYGEVVASPALRVEVVVQRLEENAPHTSRAFVEQYFREGVPDAPYQPTVRDTMCFQAITMMKAYQNYSFEELRLASGTWSDIQSGVSAFSSNVMPADRLQVRTQPDGSYVAVWMPRAPGTYHFRCTLDDRAIPQDLTLNVAENTSDGAAESSVTGGGLLAPSMPSKLRRFSAKYSAGLRVRASPSLQAEEIGKVPPGGNIAFAEEVRIEKILFVLDSPFIEEGFRLYNITLRPIGAEQQRMLQIYGNFYFTRAGPGHKAIILMNKDGTWVRLTAESVSDYADGSPDAAWCLQHHRHLDKVLLIPIEENNPTAPEYSGTMNAEGHHQEDIPSWDALEFEPTDLACLDDRKLPFSIELDVADESDSSSSPFVFGLEPSKRSRIIRNESCSTSTKRMQRRSNGNSDEWWSPVKQRSSDNGRDANVILETDIEPEPAQRQEQQSENVDEKETTTESRLAQIGTQTSPESLPEDSNPVQMFLGAVAKEGRLSPKSVVRERLANRSRAYKRASSPPPPLPARIAPAPPSPKKHALSPAQAESLRAIFAALLWHEGIVHDAIACAAFLKFHPQLPKHGARVVTRPPHDMKSPRHQRHSVEVSNAGHYLRIQPSTLEALTRSGEEATASRARKVDLDMTIKEEEAQAHGSDHEPMPSVVNVLPPALRALVALWDTLYEADQLTAATDKLRRDFTEGNENDENRPLSIIRKKRDWKNISLYKTPYSVRCELCGGANVPPPLAAHMRHAHPGCRSPTNRGYDRAGVYKRADSPAPVDFPAAACGQLAQAYQLWYIYCEKCREKALKTSSVKQPKTKTISELPERVDFMPDVDHLIMKENAIFLLDLAPLTNSEPISTSPWQDTASRSPPSPPESLWKPAPPFQVLPALGAAPNIYTAVDEARYHSLGRQPPLPFIPLGLFFGVPQPLAFSEVHLPRVHRSVSMGQAGARDLASAVCPPQSRNSHPEPHDTLTGAGSSLLAQPSAALQRLVGCGSWTNAGCVSAFEAPQLDPETLIKSPVLTFVLARRDLLAHRQKLDAAVRINIVRQYAFEALNWLLRSSTQPICVHDVMWWFCTALDKYARIVPPPLVLEDNKENAANDNQRYVIPTASASAICPGGRSARGARAAFHAFLGSVSALAPSLPPSSAAGLQAVRCWALHYSPHDRSFLHRSQVFSVISKILSHSEDGTFEDALQGAIHESYHSYIKENFVWTCPDVTGWCDISVSSRQGMSGALTDGSTETFWESGDEDRNKAKWIQIAFPGGTPDDRPHIVCVHVDNTRDTSNKTLLVSFLYSVGSNDMFHMEDVEVDPKTATWVCYTLPRVSSSSLRIRCEMRGPEPAVRVRQVRVLSAPIPSPQPVATPSNIMYTLTESDTLRVFRLLTSQVFGKLLDWDRSGSEFGAEGAAVVEDGAPADDSDLREHVVGILFAGHKLTSLQRQVMSHIVCAIGCEAARVRDDWETALLCAEAAERTGEIIHEDQHPRPQTHQQDNYCFEMLSLLLALSGSAAGRAHLAQRTELLNDLLALLHTGSERVQRQVISLLRRMIQEITPQKMLAAANLGNELNGRVTLMDHLVCYLSKAITVQVKVKGAGAAQPWSANMGNSVAPVPPATWFMRGETTKKHAHLVAKLLSDIAEEKISHAWGVECRTALANYVVQVSQVTEVDRRPHNCMAAPVIWMALGALCVCEQSHIELAHELTGDGVQTRRDENDTRPFCVNHDDGTTVAVIDCRSCGPLCTECDRFLHLNRHTRTHHRQICKEEESAIRIDIHEGCGRAKLFWLLLLIDRRTLKALAEFRGMENGVCDGHTAGDGPSDGETPGLAGTCRFCGTRGNTGLLAIGNVCADQQCQEYGREACNRVLPCTHLCGGVRGERTCLPCLYGCASGAESAVPLRQDADDMCMICFTDPLQAAPAIQLTCGHVFHLHCCKKVLANKWIGPRITFSFSQCPICKEDMAHWTLDELLAPIKRLKEEVQKKALMRLEYEGLAAPGGARGRAVSDPANYAMERYAYYVCHKCGKAYFGGHARCEAETSGWWEPAELVCGACSDVAGARTCPKHGADFLEYKCRYCCSVAVFFCFGTSHFCNACHDDFQRVTNIPKHFLPQCPAGPKGEQLPGSSEQCPLHVQHPPTGEEFALGCGVCRNAHAF